MNRVDSLKELRSKGIDAVKEDIRSAASEGLKLRLRKGSGQLVQTHLLGQLKKRVARGLTVLKELRAGGV